MSFVVSLTKSAAKDYYEIKEPYKTNIKNHINELATNGLNCSNIKKLTGEFKGLFRLRVGNYRLVFSIEHENITIISILHRKESYKKR